MAFFPGENELWLNFRGVWHWPFFVFQSYCWWFRNPARKYQLRLVVYPMIFRGLYVLYISRGAGFLPSTVPPQVRCFRSVFGGSEYLFNVCVWKPRVVTVDNEDGGCNQPSWKICASQIGSFSQTVGVKKNASLPKSEDQRQLEASVSHVPNKWPLCFLYQKIIPA